jgi:addiction module HigA family antidote
MARPKKLAPIHPGEILREEFVRPYRLSANKLAAALGVPANRVTQIINGERDVTADTALRLARAFKTSAEFWMNLQKLYELEVADHAVGAKIAKTVSPIKLPHAA